MGILLTASNDAVNILSTVGFPIFMCLLLMKYMTDTNKVVSDMTKEFTDALNHNTVILQKLCDSIDKGVDVDGV